MSGLSLLKRAFVMTTCAVSALSVAGCASTDVLDSMFKTDKEPEEVLSSFFRLKGEEKKILEAPDLGAHEKIVALLDKGKEIHDLTSQMDPGTISIGLAVQEAHLNNLGAKHRKINPDDQGFLENEIRFFNTKTNIATGLQLPLPHVWLVEDLSTKVGYPALYGGFGDVIMIDSSMTPEHMSAALAAEFGSRATNRLYEAEIASRIGYDTVLSVMEKGQYTDEMTQAFKLAAGVQRECELTENVIAANLVGPKDYQRLMLEMYADNPTFGYNPENLIDEQDFIDHFEIMDHPSPKMVAEAINRLDKDGYFNAMRLPKSKYSCDAPFRPAVK